MVWRGCVGLFLSVLVSGCTYQRLPYTDAQRQAFNEAALRPDPASASVAFAIAGLTMHVPGSPAWKIVKETPAQVVVGRALLKGYSIAATADRVFPWDESYGNPVEFLEVMRTVVRRRWANRGPFLREEEAFDTTFGAFGVQSRFSYKVAKDRTPDPSVASYEHWYVLLFLRPDDKRNLYIVSYSERTPSPMESSSLGREARAFFDRLELVAIR